MFEAAVQGRVGREVMQRHTAKGAPYLTFSVAVAGANNAGEAEWVHLAAFGDVLATVPPDLMPGETVYAEGKAQVRRWTDKTGRERGNVNITCSRIVVMGRIGKRARRPRKLKAQDGETNGATSAKVQAPLADDPGDDPIPF
jgi:single-stranded DNA-binding protein